MLVNFNIEVTVLPAPITSIFFGFLEIYFFSSKKANETIDTGLVPILLSVYTFFAVDMVDCTNTLITSPHKLFSLHSSKAFLTWVIISLSPTTKESMEEATEKIWCTAALLFIISALSTMSFKFAGN